MLFDNSVISSSKHYLFLIKLTKDPDVVSKGLCTQTCLPINHLHLKYGLRWNNVSRWDAVGTIHGESQFTKTVQLMTNHGCDTRSLKQR